MHFADSGSELNLIHIYMFKLKTFTNSYIAKNEKKKLKKIAQIFKKNIHYFI